MGRWNQSTKSTHSTQKQSVKKKASKKNAKKARTPAMTKHAIKRGLASLFVCLVVLVPVGFTINQWVNVFGLHLFSQGSDDSAKVAANHNAAPLATMQIRPADQGNPPVKPFEQPLITVTFDDGWETVYTKAVPLFQQYGIPTTQYVLSGQQNNPSYLTFEQMKSLHNAGHDIGCHTVSHPDLTTLSQADLVSQLAGCQQTIQKEVGVTPRDFAAPYGHTNTAVLAAIKQTYRSERNTNGDITTNQADDQDINVRATFDRYNITAVTIRRETTDAQLQSAIDYAVQHNGWLVLNYHDINDDQSAFGVSTDTLKRQLALVSHSSARVVTMGQVLDALDKEGK